jgi:hypothetical protein
MSDRRIDAFFRACLTARHFRESNVPFHPGDGQWLLHRNGIGQRATLFLCRRSCLRYAHALTHSS